MLICDFVKVARSSGNQFACKGMCCVGMLREVGYGDCWLIVRALSGENWKILPKIDKHERLISCLGFSCGFDCQERRLVRVRGR